MKWVLMDKKRIKIDLNGFFSIFDGFKSIFCKFGNSTGSLENAYKQ